MVFKYIKDILLHIGKIPYSQYITKDQMIAYYDWWDCAPDNMWFTEFIRNSVLEKNYYNFYSVFGKGKFIKRNQKGKKIFYSGENIEDINSICKWKYGNYCLDYVDISLGFGNLVSDKYLRFPLWLLLFPPVCNIKTIEMAVEDINNTQYSKSFDCSVLASHDKRGTRKMICDGVNDILEIKYAGGWRNNTNELKDKYNDNKIEYLKQFRFNICPENVNTKYYVTEKIFDAFRAGSIPIYYGSENDPEPGIINKDAVIFWEPNSENHSARKLIAELNTNEKMYREFMGQKKLLPYTSEYIFETFKLLKERLS